MGWMMNLPLQSLLQTATECHTLLAAVDVPYVTIEGLTVCLYGCDRGSRNVDLLVRHGDWERIRSALESLGYVWNAFSTCVFQPVERADGFSLQGRAIE